jgi:2-polyprenyl-6-methoxyphenol hydroxylase-like FAD-dependent oxidoreductase
MGSGTDVLVIGAGPTGLATALQAHAHGATVRLVERRPRAFRPSRAMIMHPRTLEILRPLGVVDAILERGHPAPRAQVHLGRRRVDVRLGDVALDDTAFPHLTLVRQADVEAVLARALRDRGVVVERGVELVTAASTPERARVVLRSTEGFEEATCRFVAGCDGSASAVRRAADIGWHGGPYHEEIVLADVELEGDLAPGILHVVVAAPGLVFLFALGEGATWRLLATRRARPSPTAPAGHAVPAGEPVPAAQVQAILRRSGLPASVTSVAWSTNVPLQHRLAEAFRSGRLFLAGDAAHTHSPAAAQGMNTGILDAVNLGWKLAFAAGSDDPPDALLRSYEQERRPADRQVLALTHLAYLAEASTRPLPALLRGTVAPLAAPAVPAVTGSPWLMGRLVRLLSQGWVNYRRSPLSVTGARDDDGPRPGDRLPDGEATIDGRTTRVHTATSRPGLHVLLHRDAAAPDPADLGPLVHVHRVDSWPGDGVVVLRPDGHVGYASRRSDAAGLAAWFDLVSAPCAPSRVRPATG